MIRKLATLGVALCALAALSAAVASAAFAAQYTTTAPTTLTGESALGNNTFNTEGGKAECKAHYQAPLNSSSSSLTVTPTYTKCRAFGFLSATVTMNGCDYLFTEPLGSGDSYAANYDIKCPAGKVIEIVAGTCKVTIGEQGPLSSVLITNETPTNDILIRFGGSEIGYIVVSDGFGCPFSGTGAKEGATDVQDSAITLGPSGGATVKVD